MVIFQRHPVADMVPIRIASLQWQSSYCRAVKTIKGMTEERPERTAARSQAQKYFTSSGPLHTPICTHSSWGTHLKLFPYIEYNKYVCVWRTEQSNQDVALLYGNSLFCKQLILYWPGLGLSWLPCWSFTFSQPCVWPTKPDSCMLTHTHLTSSLLSCVWASEIRECNRRHVAAMSYGPLVGHMMASVSFPASGWTLCQSNRTQAEISWPRVLTSKDEADSREPGCTYSLHSAPDWSTGTEQSR